MPGDSFPAYPAPEASRIFEFFTEFEKEFADLYYSHLNMIFGISGIPITVCADSAVE